MPVKCDSGDFPPPSSKIFSKQSALRGRSRGTSGGSFMVSPVFEWRQLIEGAKRLKGDQQGNIVEAGLPRLAVIGGLAPRMLRHTDVAVVVYSRLARICGMAYRRDGITIR
jgi:hypothetical protein